MIQIALLFVEESILVDFLNLGLALIIFFCNSGDKLAILQRTFHIQFLTIIILRWQNIKFQIITGRQNVLEVWWSNRFLFFWWFFHFCTNILVIQPIVANFLEIWHPIISDIREFVVSISLSPHLYILNL